MSKIKDDDTAFSVHVDRALNTTQYTGIIEFAKL